MLNLWSNFKPPSMLFRENICFPHSKCNFVVSIQESLVFEVLRETGNRFGEMIKMIGQNWVFTSNPKVPHGLPLNAETAGS